MMKRTCADLENVRALNYILALSELKHDRSQHTINHRILTWLYVVSFVDPLAYPSQHRLYQWVCPCVWAFVCPLCEPRMWPTPVPLVSPLVGTCSGQIGKMEQYKLELPIIELTRHLNRWTGWLVYIHHEALLVQGIIL